MPKPKPTLKELIQDLKSSQPDNQLKAARALRRLGPQAAPAVPGLMKLLTGPDVKLADTAAWALKDIGPKASRAVKPLVQVAENQGLPRRLRTSAMVALWNKGAAVAPALPRLQELLRSGPNWLRGPCAYAITEAGPRAVPLLLNHLEAFPSAVGSALECRAQHDRQRFQPSLIAALSTLARLAAEGEPSVRKECVSILGHLGKVGRSVLPLLCDIIKDPSLDSELRHHAVMALAHIGRALKPDPAVQQALIEAMTGAAKTGSVNFYDSYWMSQALEAQAPAITPALKKLVKHPSKQVREIVTRALKEMKETARG